jgi:hypothetical protein
MSDRTFLSAPGSSVTRPLAARPVAVSCEEVGDAAVLSFDDSGLRDPVVGPHEESSRRGRSAAAAPALSRGFLPGHGGSLLRNEADVVTFPIAQLEPLLERLFLVKQAIERLCDLERLRDT